MTDQPASPPPRRRGRRRRLSGWTELAVLLVVALLASLLVKTFLLQVFFVPSASMRPLLKEQDRIVVEKVSLWRGAVERGDVVVFEDPGGWLPPQARPRGVRKVFAVLGLYPSGGHLVKRVVAVGGDTVACCDLRGRVTVNGSALRERDYLNGGQAPSRQRFSVEVPEARLWVMGDNRGNSDDSRFHQERDLGTVPAGAVVGRVVLRLWPADRIDLVRRPRTYRGHRLDAGAPAGLAAPR